jgi:pre-rRNA-processing protein TSR1
MHLIMCMWMDFNLMIRHKFERFLQPGKPAVGSVYAPIQFAPAPVTLFKLVDGIPLLIGSGSVLTNDPTRILV